MTSEDKPAGPREPAQDAAREPDAVHPDLPAEPAAPAQLPGEFLAAQRQKLNLSIDAVAMRVRLAPRQIVALEANDFAALPGTATVRGFVRSYAKLLGLDPAPLVAMLAPPNQAFDAVAARRPLPASGFRPRRYAPPGLHRRGARRLAGLAAVVLVFVGTLAYVAYRNDWLQALPPDAASAPSAPSEGAAGEADHAPAQSPASAGAPSADSVQQQAAPAATAGVLELKARADSWVEVIAINGERKLFSKLIKAGSTELVEVTEPVVLIIGNAAGVDALLRGEPLNLAAVARDNIVRLSLK